MKLNTIKPNRGSRPGKKRLGRGLGSGLGKTGGRGEKGQFARTGASLKPGFEGGQTPLHRRLPKYGFTSAIAKITAEIRLSELSKVEAEIIDVAALKIANVIPYAIKRVKVIKSGELKKAVTLKGIAVTAGAREAITAAGGKIVE